MRVELPRQLIHLSGFLFIVMAQFLDKVLLSFYLLTISVTFFIYSLYLEREEKKLLKIIESVEMKMRDFIFRFERGGNRPFTGAIWFFFSAGISFLIFPLDIASASVFMLSIGDSISTLIGKEFGKHKLIGEKSIEGSIAMFLSNILAIIFLPLFPVILGSLTATLVELLPDTKRLNKLRKRGLIDDNLLVPIFSGVVMYIVMYI